MHDRYSGSSMQSFRPPAKARLLTARSGYFAFAAGGPHVFLWGNPSRRTRFRPRCGGERGRCHNKTNRINRDLCLQPTLRRSSQAIDFTRGLVRAVLCQSQGDPRAWVGRRMATTRSNSLRKHSATPSRAMWESDSFKAVFYSVLLALQFGFQAFPPLPTLPTCDKMPWLTH